MHVSLSFQKTEGVLQNNQLLNDVEREVTDDINCVRVKAADVQHAAVFRVSDGQRVCNQSTHNQFGKYTAFLKKENTNIYAFSRRFYPKRLTIAFRLYIFISTCVPWESNPQPFTLLMQCSTTEPHRNKQDKNEENYAESSTFH